MSLLQRMVFVFPPVANSAVTAAAQANVESYLQTLNDSICHSHSKTDSACWKPMRQDSVLSVPFQTIKTLSAWTISKLKNDLSVFLDNFIQQEKKKKREILLI